MPRTTIRIGDVDLSRVSVYLAVPISGAKAMQISAKKLSGVWAARTLEVKKRIGLGPAESFGTAKTFAAGGGAALTFTETELAGIAELEVQAGGTTETGYVRLEASIEYDATTAAPGQFFTPPNVGGGPVSIPGGGIPVNE